MKIILICGGVLVLLLVLFVIFAVSYLKDLGEEVVKAEKNKPKGNVKIDKDRIHSIMGFKMLVSFFDRDVKYGVFVPELNNIYVDLPILLELTEKDYGKYVDSKDLGDELKEKAIKVYKEYVMKNINKFM